MVLSVATLEERKGIQHIIRALPKVDATHPEFRYIVLGEGPYRPALESLIRELGCKAGLVFNPATPLDYMDHVMGKLDLVLIMSVNPGFGGQAFLPSALRKIRRVAERIADAGRDVRVEVDGGIKVDNVADAARAGADTFVAGSAIFALVSLTGFQFSIIAILVGVMVGKAMLTMALSSTAMNVPIKMTARMTYRLR